MAPPVSGQTLSPQKITELTELISNLPEPEGEDLPRDVKKTMLEAISMTKREAIRHMQLHRDPTVLVNDEITSKRIIFRTLHNILTTFGVAKRHNVGTSIVEVVFDSLFEPESHRDVNETCHSLFRSYVNNCAGAAPPITLGNPGPRSPVESQTEQNAQSNTFQDSLSRRLGSVSSVFRDNSCKFSGSFSCTEGLSLHRFMQLYESVTSQYEIPNQQRVRHLTHALRGPALDFFMDKVQDTATTLDEAFLLFKQKFDSQYSRAQAQAYLDSISIASIRDTERCSTAKALEIAQQRISSVGPMCGPA